MTEKGHSGQGRPSFGFPPCLWALQPETGSADSSTPLFFVSVASAHVPLPCNSLQQQHTLAHLCMPIRTRGPRKMHMPRGACSTGLRPCWDLATEGASTTVHTRRQYCSHVTPNLLILHCRRAQHNGIGGRTRPAGRTLHSCRPPDGISAGSKKHHPYSSTGIPMAHGAHSPPTPQPPLWQKAFTYTSHPLGLLRQVWPRAAPGRQ